MNSRLWLLVSTAIGVLLVVSWTGAAPILNPDNGHYYERVDRDRLTGCTWAVAKAEAEALSHLGVAGHLATVTSQEERDFILDNLGTYDELIHHWLGGYQYVQTDEPAGGWGWVTGEPWVYTDWKQDGNPDNDWGSHGYFGGEPDGSDEEAVCLWDDPNNEALWNDADEFGEVKGYIVEYPVPEPATLWILGGLGALALRRLRK